MLRNYKKWRNLNQNNQKEVKIRAEIGKITAKQYTDSHSFVYCLWLLSSYNYSA